MHFSCFVSDDLSDFGHIVSNNYSALLILETETESLNYATKEVVESLW